MASSRAQRFLNTLAWLDVMNGKCDRFSVHTTRKDRQGFVYLVYNPDTDLFKIGMAVTPKDRLAILKGCYPNLIVVHLIATSHLHTSERRWHQFFGSKWVSREWFRLEKHDLELFCAGNVWQSHSKAHIYIDIYQASTGGR